MKKIFTIISLLSISATGLFAQADTASNATNWKGTPNPGFENWTAFSGYSNPDGWSTANSQETILASYNVVKATGANVKSGSAAVELITQSEAGLATAPGIVTTGTIPTSISGSITGGIAYTLRPDSIVGWFKYTPQGSDNCFAAMYLFGSAANNADTVAEASFSTAAGVKVASYTRFAAKFVYRNTDPVANSIWLLSSSSGTTGAVVGSSAYFDDIAVVLQSTVGIANQSGPSPVFVAPNPANDHVVISNVADANNVWALYDITGRKVAEQKLAAGVNTLDVKALINGMYIYTITDDNNSPVKTGKLIIQK
jgi:hypothetical protein